ncbi:MAG TPA: lipopolysaccharide biosynthesis protein [Ktedonobacteraceae bacterium]|nr:lipopolysaccharide biosynthesis protein [Ktedonobacteraceae bacterium]
MIPPGQDNKKAKNFVRPLRLTKAQQSLEDEKPLSDFQQDKAFLSSQDRELSPAELAWPPFYVIPPSGMDSVPIDQQPTLILPVIAKAELAAQGAEKGGYVSLARNLIQSSGIYALASLASPLVSLVLAPFLTRNLSHTDYGALAVLNTAISLVAGITQLGLGSAFFRAYSYDYETERDKRAVLATVVQLLACISALAVIVVLLSSSWLAGLLLNKDTVNDAVVMAALVVLLQNLTVPGFAWLRAEKRPVFFTILSVMNLLVSLAATIIFVGVFHMGVVGALLAIGGGYGTVVLRTIPLILYRARVCFRPDIIKGLLGFGLPNAGSFISIWVLQLSDRYLLSYFGSLAQTASYAVAYSLGGVLATVIISPFSLAWPTAMYAIAKKDDAAQTFRVVFRWFSLLLLFAVYGFSLAGIGILELFFPVSYHSAYPIIPIIAVSIMFYGLHLFLTVGIAIRRKTWLVVVLTLTAAISNILLNIFLIPRYGAMGAAWSTLLAYALLALITLFVNQRIYPIPFDLTLFIVAVLVGMLLALGCTFLTQTWSWFWSAVIHLCVLALYGGCLVLLGKFPDWKQKKKYRHAKEKIR